MKNLTKFRHHRQPSEGNFMATRRPPPTKNADAFSSLASLCLCSAAALILKVFAFAAPVSCLAAEYSPFAKAAGYFRLVAAIVSEWRRFSCFSLHTFVYLVALPVLSAIQRGGNFSHWIPKSARFGQ
jgi:hypothetical protein